MDNRGFTLIELLVSVAIVGILAASSIAFYEEYKNHAYDTEVRLTMHSVLTAREGGDEVRLAIAPGANRNLTRHYNNGTSWSLTNVSDYEDVLPGVATPPGHVSVYLGENHCTTSNCLELYVRVTSCKSGMNSEKSVWANDTQTVWESYNAATDALC